MQPRTLYILCRNIQGNMTINACQTILWRLTPAYDMWFYPEFLLLSREDYTLLCRSISHKTPDILAMSSETFMRYLTQPWEDETPVQNIASIAHHYDGRFIPVAPLPDLPREPRWSEAHWTFERRGYASLPTPRRGQVYVLCDTEQRRWEAQR